jgi:hypothetical protein
MLISLPAFGLLYAVFATCRDPTQGLNQVVCYVHVTMSSIQQ